MKAKLCIKVNGFKMNVQEKDNISTRMEMFTMALGSKAREMDLAK